MSLGTPAYGPGLQTGTRSSSAGRASRPTHAWGAGPQHRPRHVLARVVRCAANDQPTRGL